MATEQKNTTFTYFRNARIIKSNHEIKKAHILCNHTIIEIHDHEVVPEPSWTVIDLGDMMLLPGAIDGNAHFYSDQDDGAESFLIATQQAAKGGFTTIIENPVNLKHPIVEPSDLQYFVSSLKKKSLLDFGVWGAIRANDYPLYYDQVIKLWAQGVIGFKILTSSFNDEYEALSYQDILDLFSTLADTDIMFGFEAIDIDLIKEHNGQIVEKFASLYGQLESSAVRKIIRRSQDNPLHFFHICNKDTAEFLTNAYKKYDVSFDVSPYNLLFEANARGKKSKTNDLNPPLQNSTDVDFLQSTIRTGKVNSVASNAGYYNDDTAIIPGTNKAPMFRDHSYMIPYLINELHIKQNIPLERVIKLWSENVARRFGLFPTKGIIEAGADADFMIVDLNAPNKITDKQSLFFGSEIQVAIDKTVLRGQVIYDRDKGLTRRSPSGEWIKRHSANKD